MSRRTSGIAQKCRCEAAHAAINAQRLDERLMAEDTDARPSHQYAVGQRTKRGDFLVRHCGRVQLGAMSIKLIS
jgi:hypothetical protein